MDRERRIPPFAEDALDVLNEAIGDAGDGLRKDEAKALLADDDRFPETDAEYALDMLQNRGHIYYVDELVYITPTDD
jgi:enolase